MYTEKGKSIIIVAASITVLILIVGLVSAFWPMYETEFIELGLLGKNQMADDYFPKENSTVSMNSQIDWYIYLYNHMATPQNVIVKVKLLNSTTDIPNDEEHRPSNAPSIIEIPISLSSNETRIAPFFWGITETTSIGNSLYLKQLRINNQIIEVDVSTPLNSFFRLVFEPWVFNSSTGEYQFGFEYGEEFSSISLHMGFRVS